MPPGRAQPACTPRRARWERTRTPAPPPAHPWTQAEYGNKWSEIAKHIPGKTGQQCAQRWRHRVNPNISRCAHVLGRIWGLFPRQPANLRHLGCRKGVGSRLQWAGNLRGAHGSGSLSVHGGGSVSFFPVFVRSGWVAERRRGPHTGRRLLHCRVPVRTSRRPHTAARQALALGPAGRSGRVTRTRSWRRSSRNGATAGRRSRAGEWAGRARPGRAGQGRAGVKGGQRGLAGWLPAGRPAALCKRLEGSRGRRSLAGAHPSRAAASAPSQCPASPRAPSHPARPLARPPAPPGTVDCSVQGRPEPYQLHPISNP